MLAVAVLFPCSSPVQNWLLSTDLIQSELLYDWQFTANQFILAPSPLRPTTGILFPTEHLGLQFLCNILSDERMGLTFTISDGSLQRSHSWVRVPRDPYPNFTVSHSKLPQPGRPVPPIYIPQEQGAPVIPPCTGFPFRRLLRLSGLPWRY
jgi:hypothetical protein